MRIRITDTIVGEYQSRDVFPSAWSNSVDTDEPTIRAMLSDAEYYCHPYGPDIPHTLVRAYASHADRLRTALRESINA